MSDAFETLGARLRDDLTRHEEVDRISEARTRRQVLARMSKGHAPRRGLRLAFAGAALASVAAALWLWTPGASREPLRFWVEDRAGHVDEWVTARDAEQSLRFSDGSSLIAGPRTTTRVMHISSDGAQLTLERGGIDAHVVHREASRWQVAAGPFVVHVTGTRFHVAWDPQAEKLLVKVSEGRVEVTGDNETKHVLTAGSSLELVARHEPAAASGEAELPPSPVASAPTPTPSPSVTSAVSDEEELIHPKKLEKKPDFRELSTAGHYKEALQAVEQQGFKSTCETLGARDLLTLASTARLAGRADLSREAYHTARRRFPGSTEAGISAFSLGRLASDAGRASDAIGWFTRYLSEQPNGQLAREASGRLLELLSKGSDPARAKQAAASYLAQYPNGPHAALARSVLAPR